MIDDLDDLLRMKQAAALVGVSRDTLRRLIQSDMTFPPFIQISPGVRVVRRRDVLAWFSRRQLEARERQARTLR